MSLSELKTLFEGAAMAEPYGEDISIRDHMLQCAELARARGLAAPLIAAALLHDIGWGIGGAGAAVGHEDMGADMLLPLFGPEVAEPIRLHVAAKRYLVAAQPAYQARLSDCSRQTLALQGGAFTPAECARFAAGPYFAAAIALRQLDDAGKDLRPPRDCFADYVGLLARLSTGG